MSHPSSHLSPLGEVPSGSALLTFIAPMVWALPFPCPPALLGSSCKDLLGPAKWSVAFTKRLVFELLPQPGTLLCCPDSLHPAPSHSPFTPHRDATSSGQPLLGVAACASSDDGLSYCIVLTCSIPKWLHVSGRQWSRLFIHYYILPPMAQHAVGLQYPWSDEWINELMHTEDCNLGDQVGIRILSSQKMWTQRTEFTAKYYFNSGFIIRVSTFNISTVEMLTVAGGGSEKAEMPHLTVTLSLGGQLQLECSPRRNVFHNVFLRGQWRTV